MTGPSTVPVYNRRFDGALHVLGKPLCAQFTDVFEKQPARIWQRILLGCIPRCWWQGGGAWQLQGLCSCS